MKRNFLKTSLSAFAFTLAIVASFAFSPVNGAEDDPVNGYIQVILPEACNKVTHGCINGPNNDCTIPVQGGGTANVYATRTGTSCSNQLTRP